MTRSTHDSRPFGPSAPTDGGARVTWTQRDNGDMRALNERLGYVYGAESITVRGPLPLPAAAE